MASGPSPVPHDSKEEALSIASWWPAAPSTTRHGRPRAWTGGADAPANADLVRRLAVAELAEGIAHDLKNQLTVVAASVQLARDVHARGRDDLLDKAWRSAMRAARLMDEMLRYTQGVAGPAAPADAAEALETAVAGAWGYCGVRRVQLEMRLAADLPSVRGPAPALRILLLYLLRWVADRCPPDCRLVAEAAAARSGVAVRLYALVADGQPLGANTADPAGPTAGGAAGNAAVLEALAAEAGAVFQTGPRGPMLWLSPADGSESARVLSASD